MIDKMLLDWAAAPEGTAMMEALWGSYVTYWITKDILLQIVFRAARMIWAVAVWLWKVGCLHFGFVFSGLGWVNWQYQRNITKKGRTCSFEFVDGSKKAMKLFKSQLVLGPGNKARYIIRPILQCGQRVIFLPVNRNTFSCKVSSIKILASMSLPINLRMRSIDLCLQTLARNP